MVVVYKQNGFERNGQRALFLGISGVLWKFKIKNKNLKERARNKFAPESEWGSQYDFFPHCFGRGGRSNWLPTCEKTSYANQCLEMIGHSIISDQTFYNFCARHKQHN